jgi:hypothetical protein
VCEPDVKFCEDNRVMACAFDGGSTLLWTDCGPFYHCVEEGDTARCEANACTPAEKVCDGNVLKTCTEEGTLPAKGKNCGDDVCDAAECKPRVCEPRSLFCKEGAVYSCSETGAAENLSFFCDARTSCVEGDGEPECVARVCEPTTSACIGEAFGTCAADGFTLTTAGTDCAATDQVCDLSAGCASTAVDTVGKRKDVEPLGSGDLASDVLDVTSSRRLTEIETNWLLEQPRDVRFVVYELGTDDLFHVVYDEIVSHTSGSGFVSSGPIDVSLDAGKRYLVGSGLVVGDGYAYYDTSGWTGFMSFATVLGSQRNPHADEVGFGLNTSSLYMLRLTTEAP